MSLAAIQLRLAENRLAVLGGFHPRAEGGLPATCQTLLLIGLGAEGGLPPKGIGGSSQALEIPPFTNRLPGWRDAQPDPLELWSRRVIGRMACDLGAKAAFPYGGPFAKFFADWVKISGLASGGLGDLRVAHSCLGAVMLRAKLDLPADMIARR